MDVMQFSARTTRRLSRRALHALGEFFRLQAAGGIVLIVAAVLALVCANSPLEHLYESFRTMPVAVVARTRDERTQPRRDRAAWPASSPP